MYSLESTLNFSYVVIYITTQYDFHWWGYWNANVEIEEEVVFLRFYPDWGAYEEMIYRIILPSGSLNDVCWLLGLITEMGFFSKGACICIVYQ